ncbi:MAG TPA: DUF4124 domain-containing protein [Gammaproteobacteria bacterium]|nr:DUF4124 domain-containing protein [Gammaproteobacteria bacterium]
MTKLLTVAFASDYNRNMWGTGLNLRLTTWIGVAALAVSLAAPAFGASSSEIYKWVDKNGVVHYGDQVPPEYARQKREVINRQGMTVDVLPAQKTPAELAAERERREAAAARQRQQQRDQLLLNAYRSVADIKHARDNHVSAIMARINITQNAIDALKQQLEDLYQRAAQEDPAPAALTGQIAKLEKQLAANQQALADEQAEKSETEQEFAADIARFKELKAGNAG